jgi:uncharacterized repeat protein (TIGR01451 family)
MGIDRGRATREVTSMLSRGALGLASSRTRRAFALSWSVLFILSLLLQYATFAMAPSALAAHNEGLFELDGNAVDNTAAAFEPADDWDSTNHSLAHFFAGAATEAEANDTTYFTTGGSKDENDIPSWAITSTAVPDKDELTDAYGAIYDKNGETWFYFGADRFDNDGDAQIGFWFFQNKVGIANGDFTGTHADGDVLILSEYTNGGVVDLVCAYEWDGAGGGSNIAAKGNCDPATSGSHLNLVAAGAACDVADGTFDICARTNAATATAPWTFTNKDGAHDFATGQFFEGGINLSSMFGGQPPCFGTFLAETRSSQETDAQLKDFALGSLSTCVPPTITTTSSTANADFGGSVTDTANLSGSSGNASGTVSFFICNPAQVTAAGCPVGAGAQVGSAVAVNTAGNPNTATSAAYTVGVTAAAAGKYCWRAEYTPDADSQYLAGSHTNATTECFTVAPATISIAKTANPAGPVNAGDSIGFDVVVSNTGTQTTLGVSVNDPLPAGVDWTLGAITGGASCAINGAVGSEVLTCTKATLAAGASFSVHVSAQTDKTDCGTISNTANVTTSNDGAGISTASVVVNCPDVTVQKTAKTGVLKVGDTAEWDIVVSNIGTGIAHDVTLTDPLPGNISWQVSHAGCSIVGSTLTCSLGDLAPNASVTIVVTGNTDTEGSESQDCITLDNTATVTSSNEPASAGGNNEASASIVVTCTSALVIDKTLADTGATDPDLGVPAADIGDTLHYTLAYSGAGPLTNAVITDVLPQGLEYVAGTALGNADFNNGTYDSATRTITWHAKGTLPDPASGAVTYDAKVLATAPDFAQPLVNIATIDSDQTPPDSDTAAVAVLAPPEELTPPPTDTFTPQTGTSNPGFALMLILLGVAAVTLSIGFVTPVPARMSRRDRRG